MGYTHYFKQLKPVADQQWTLFTAQVANVFLLIQNRDVLGQETVICDSTGTIVLRKCDELFRRTAPGSQNCISFNGYRLLDLDHESFLLCQHVQRDWFCKTAAKPYDFLVVATLILANTYCPDCYEISSDGEERDWLPVLQWLREHIDPRCSLPQRIEPGVSLP